MVKKATFAGGCFWGVEAKLQLLTGVLSTKVGYTGGNLPNPSYRDVCLLKGGHVEAVLIEYESDILSYDVLIEAFFTYHDPTASIKTCHCFSPQYQSVIFYANEDEQTKATLLLERLRQSGTYTNPITTELRPATVFYLAEEYHQNYYRKHNLSVNMQCGC